MLCFFITENSVRDDLNSRRLEALADINISSIDKLPSAVPTSCLNKAQSQSVKHSDMI